MFGSIFPHGSRAVEYGTVQGGADDVLAPEPDYISEFCKYKAVVGSQKDRMNKCGREVQSMQLKTAGETIEIDLR